MEKEMDNNVNTTETEGPIALGSTLLNEMAKAEGFTQPILYLERIPVADKINDIIKKNANCLLHTSPLLSSIQMNAAVLDRLNDEEFVNNVGPMGMQLHLNQIRITIEQIFNYVVQNTTIAFCNMLDYTGKHFRAIIDYLPIKNYVQAALIERESQASIYAFFCSNIRRFDQYTFDNAFDMHIKDYERCSKVCYAYHQELTSQLCSIIYTKLCEACDKAITEVLLGTRVSPNLKYIIDAGCVYFGMKPSSQLDAKNELYFRLNTALTNMIDKFMSITIVPMSTAVCEQYIFQSFHYAYALVEKEYIHNTNARTMVEDYDSVINDQADEPFFNPVQ